MRFAQLLASIDHMVEFGTAWRRMVAQPESPDRRAKDPVIGFPSPAAVIPTAW